MGYNRFVVISGFYDPFNLVIFFCWFIPKLWIILSHSLQNETSSISARISTFFFPFFFSLFPILLCHENLKCVSKHCARHTVKLNLNVFVNSNARSIHSNYWLMACVHDGSYSPLLYKFGKMYEISNRTVQNKRTGEKFGPENIIAQYLTRILQRV